MINFKQTVKMFSVDRLLNRFQRSGIWLKFSSLIHQYKRIPQKV